MIEPGEGALASRGEFGRGRLPDPADLLARVEAELPAGNRPWDGLRVLVTAGGTREPIDPVRFIGNRSSGRMGMALATAAARRGADVTLIAANVSLPTPPSVHRIDVETADQLAQVAPAKFPSTHVLLMAAAPADFRATEIAESKLKRQDALDLHLQPTEDILASLAASRTEHQTVVGFAAEHGGDAIERARGKLTPKGADLIVLNDVSDPAIGFESAENAVTLIDEKTRPRSLELQGRNRRRHPPESRPAKSQIGPIDSLVRRVAWVRGVSVDPRPLNPPHPTTGPAGRPLGPFPVTDQPAPRTKRAILTPSFYVPTRCREVGLAHFFFAPNQA